MRTDLTVLHKPLYKNQMPRDEPYLANFIPSYEVFTDSLGSLEVRTFLISSFVAINTLTHGDIAFALGLPGGKDPESRGGASSFAAIGIPATRVENTAAAANKLENNIAKLRLGDQNAQ
ncbi:hypothetical protein HYFRA_00008660 [Hymenoscyphus fraxineus]|uniref:Uncharacterized protein n=1 Tax=Hymenoscyphus fraxineus TaxID=746836 RepID=A0A9N9KW71_9HELO|nr:hypothetical protein HYFRA_00008660 [Hymenoscyphus fraxineus]